ncbi:hypothetical protein RND71_004869 [Anisodus tanguticus]|uniref:Auxin-responsive protein n=1 Tax=Anisodus tanguticus TaxID=243964 RepID=A0AAE1SRQ9_9SOLA|nr:hypothetical protein RND71_004869 [Anisodus tanguticus]
METTFGLLCGNDTSSSVSKMDMCSESNSSYTDETGLELGLGLGPSLTKAKKSSTWCEYGRIFTAKDFPNGFLTGRVNNVDGVFSINNGADCAGSSTENIGSASTSSRMFLSSAFEVIIFYSKMWWWDECDPFNTQVVGWPPIRTYRMNSFNQSKITNVDQEENGFSGNKEMESSKKKMYHGNNTKNDADFVKVNMDGLPIGRKVDLSSHSCYETLAKILEEMFIKSTNTTNFTNRGEKEVTKTCKLLDGSSEFVLTYEDKDGDWMLVGDVPWGMFLSTVKKLRIMRTTEAKGLGM